MIKNFFVMYVLMLSSYLIISMESIFGYFEYPKSVKINESFYYFVFSVAFASIFLIFKDYIYLSVFVFFIMIAFTKLFSIVFSMGILFILFSDQTMSLVVFSIVISLTFRVLSKKLKHLSL